MSETLSGIQFTKNRQASADIRLQQPPTGGGVVFHFPETAEEAIMAMFQDDRLSGYDETTRLALARADAEAHAPYLFVVEKLQGERAEVVRAVQSAVERIRPVIPWTRLETMTKLTNETGSTILLKREDESAIRSFKGRGAMNMIAQLPPEQRAGGVMAATMGNHGQGVVRAANYYGVPATLVVPIGTPDVKVEASKSRGAHVIKHGQTFGEAKAYVEELAATTSMVNIPAYDHPDVITGQATIGLEMITERPDIQYYVLPIGGGGMAAGIAEFIKTVNPSAKVIGVQYDKSDAAAQSFRNGQLVTLARPGNFAEGVSVSTPGTLTMAKINEFVDQIVTVPENEIRLAQHSIFEQTGIYPEAAGALGLAGVLNLIKTEDLKGAVLATIDSGANIDPRAFAENVSEVNYLLGKETTVEVTLPEQPGAFRTLAERLLAQHNVVGFDYVYSNDASASILLSVRTADHADRQKVNDLLQGYGYPSRDLSNDRSLRKRRANMHGGQGSYTGQSCAYLVTFPERTGALVHFLKVMNDKYNIGRFHYRATGGDEGEVFITFQADDQAKLEARLQETGYSFDYLDGEA